MKLSVSLIRTVSIAAVLSLGSAGFAQMVDATNPLLLRPGLPLTESDDAVSLGIDDGGSVGSGQGGYGNDPDRGGRSKTNETVSRSQTGQIVKFLDAGGIACAALQEVEQIDCVRDAVASAWRATPETGDYAQMRKDLGVAWRKLDALVAANQDTSVRPKVKRVVSKGISRRTATPIRAVRGDRVKAVKKQAVAVVNELSTNLLRSASSSAARGVHYERAAQALNSTKVLLRSA